MSYALTAMSYYHLVTLKLSRQNNDETNIQNYDICTKNAYYGELADAGI